jgi:serine kinase of HPr protein (carbohydrate metabolism regulator)
MSRLLVHGTCLAVGGHGVLLRGKPGSGKSALALRLIDEPGLGTGQRLLAAHLVADDQVVLTAGHGGVLASAPEALAGLLEVRGLGLLRLAHQPSVHLALLVDLAPRASIERLPDPGLLREDLLGQSLPRITLDAGLPEAPAIVRAALLHLVETPPK